MRRLTRHFASGSSVVLPSNPAILFELYVDSSRIESFWASSGKMSSLAHTMYVHSFSFSFAWTGYFLEKKVGGLRFLVLFVFLMALSEAIRYAMFSTAKNLPGIVSARS